MIKSIIKDTVRSVGKSTVKSMGMSWSSYWLPQSYVVENADADALIVTYAKKPNPAEMIVGNFAVSGNTISSINADVTGLIFTFALGTSIVYGDAPTLTTNGLSYNITNNVALEAEVNTYITGLTTPLSEIQKNKLCRFVFDLKDGLSIDNLSDVFDLIYILAGETQESSLRNIVKNAHHGTLGGVTQPGFSAGLGFLNTGSGFIDTNYNPSTQAVRASLNSMTIAAYSKTNTNESSGYCIMGYEKKNDPHTPPYLYIFPSLSEVLYYTNNTNTNQSVANTDSRGLIISSRTANNLTSAYRNGVLLDSDATVSTGLNNGKITLLAKNFAETIPAARDSYSYHRISFVAIGRGLSDDEAMVLGNAVTKLVEPVSKIRSDFSSLGFGSLIGYSIISFTNSINQKPDADPNTFNPTDLDIDEWLDTCVIAGMSYAALTVKAHDGFCLWPTEFADPLHDPYSVEQSSWYIDSEHSDIVKLFVDGCNSRGLKPVFYFSIWDLTHEARTGTDETSDAASYISMIETQLTELLTNYGDITAIWFDGWGWHVPYTNIPYATIYNHVKSIQPNCLVISNDHLLNGLNTEIDVYEASITGSVTLGNNLPAQEVQSPRVDGQWISILGQSQTASDYLTKTQINDAKELANSRGATFMLALTPDETGHLPTVHKNILESLTT